MTFLINSAARKATDMKKYILLFLMFCLMFLTACDPNPYYYNYETLKNDVVSVELINYDNNAIELFEQRDAVKKFDFSKMNVTGVLLDEKLDDFLLEFSQIEFMLVWRHLDSPEGECVKINYSDGSFDIICYNVQFSCQYDNFGNVKYVIGSGGGYQLKELVERSF